VVPASPETDPLIEICDVMRIFVARPPETDNINMLHSILRQFGGVQQYPVHGRKYRIDLYFPEYRVAVECDEGHHETKTGKEKDRRRENLLKQTLDCEFYRFDPFADNFRFSTVAADLVALLTKKAITKEVQKALADEKEQSRTGNNPCAEIFYPPISETDTRVG
jgi:very-short-patch-repair endonuclease